MRPPPTLLVTVDGALVTACCGVHPTGRSPFHPLHHRWRMTTTPAELEALRDAGPWFSLICHLCTRSIPT